MKKRYDILAWDSNFFGYKVGRINDLPVTKDDLSHFIKNIKQDNLELAYFSSSKAQINILNSFATHFDIKLVDTKVTYHKVLKNNPVTDKNIVAYTKDYPEEKLLNLAVESGVYSRFNVDKNIASSKFEALYQTWMINSVNKKIAKEVLVCYIKDEIAGFVTLGEKNNRADIGIIAVDKNFRGQGIGKSLMFAAENWFIQKGYASIQVVTQKNNFPACGLYEYCGYEVDKMDYFFHLWRIQ